MHDQANASTVPEKFDHLFWPLLWVWAIVLPACATILVVFRLHAFDLPLETDECNYAYIAGRLLEGDRLYVDVWDHQPFGVFVLFASVIPLFGDAAEVFRWLATAFSLASMALIALIVQAICGIRSVGAALLAALLFALVSADPSTAGEGANREIFMNTFVLAAWYCAIAAFPSLRRDQKSTGSPPRAKYALLVIAGLMLGIGSTIKTILAIHWLFLAIWIVAGAWRTSQRNRGVAATRAVLLFGLGPMAIWVASFAYFAATGRLSEFVDAVFLANLSYAEGTGFFQRFVTFFDPPRHPFIFESAAPVWILAIPATAWLAFMATVRRELGALAVLLLILAAYFAVCMPSRFWPHYYYLLLPPCVIALAVAGDIASLAAKHPRIRLLQTILVLIVPIAVFFWQYRHYLSQPPFGITVKRYNSRDFWGRAHGQNVERVTDPADRVFVFGNEAEIYYYSGRRCASRYTMITGLADGMAGAGERREMLISELKAQPPRLIMVLFDQEPFPAWREFLHEYYTDPVGWDFHDATGKPIMFVVARKDKPMESIDWNWDRSEVGGWLPGE